MSVQKLHWLVKQRYNKLDSNHYRDLTPLELDEAINDAQFQFLERVVFVEDMPRFDMVSNLIVSASEQGSITPVNAVGNVYEFDLDALTYPYYHYKRAYADTDCGTTKVEIVGHGRLSDILTDAMSRPSRKWRRLVGTFAKSSSSDGKSLYVYSEPGWVISSLNIEYVRKPKNVFFGGYDTIEYLECVNTGGSNCAQWYSSASDPQDCEIADDYHTLIADYAVRELSRILKDVPSFQLQTEKTNSIT